MAEYPRKESYKLSELCQYTDTQPYVIRFWESEFPQLGTRAGGVPRSYRQEDIDLVRRIKQLLYEEEFTLEGARAQLERELGNGGTAARRPAREPEPEPEPPQRPVRTASPPRPRLVATSASDGVSRERYDDAIEEIDHLRLQLKEADKERRKAEAAKEAADRLAEDRGQRAERAIETLERLLRSLS